MRSGKLVFAGDPDARGAALRELVRALARQAAAEHVHSALRGGADRPYSPPEVSG